ncbi:MAG: class I SAM-dependent RNA methyltransferase [Lachnospiraceae bacterium]|nr:class I SAM-dependent RNA methyltransferase [Lachnospiraceae bacterium]
MRKDNNYHKNKSGKKAGFTSGAGVSTKNRFPTKPEAQAGTKHATNSVSKGKDEYNSVFKGKNEHNSVFKGKDEHNIVSGSKGDHEFILPCRFGVESVLKREVHALGYDTLPGTDGRVVFRGGAEALCRASVNIRTAERILINVGSFKATTYDELFEGTKALEIERFVPKNGAFTIAKAGSVRSKLFSPSDIQSIVKKAMAVRLSEKYHLDWLPEDGENYPFRVFIIDDVVTIGLDTSGASLHKRGYRLKSAKAPLSENLAAAMILLTPFRDSRIMVDPFCGSGTIPIECAMIAAGIAPGVNRHFVAEDWGFIDGKFWKQAREEARSHEKQSIEADIQGYDIDGDVISTARENAERAGVAHMIHFQRRAVSELRHSGSYGFIITNPPYGERIGEEEELQEIYSALGKGYRALDRWSLYMISSYDNAEKYLGLRPDKVRKIYNGMIRASFYQYVGEKPGKRSQPGK